MGTEFVPGEFWTPARADDAVRRMTETLESPAMQALMAEVATAADGNDNSAAAAAASALAGAEPATPHAVPVRPEECAYRRGRAGDVPRFAQLIIAGELPPMFIEEFVEGFVAVEHAGEVIGCGGLEIYGGCGVIRSVVIDEAARNLRIGQHMTELLLQDARAAGVTDLYLFTMHAAPFWRRLGFADAPLETWKPAARASWQYRFISQHPEAAGGVISMSRPMDAA